MIYLIKYLYKFVTKHYLVNLKRADNRIPPRTAKVIEYATGSGYRSPEPPVLKKYR